MLKPGHGGRLKQFVRCGSNSVRKFLPHTLASKRYLLSVRLTDSTGALTPLTSFPAKT